MLSSLRKWDDESIVGTNKGRTLQDKGHRCQCHHKSCIRINMLTKIQTQSNTYALNEKHCSLRFETLDK